MYKRQVSSLAKEVRIPKLHGFVINGWGADFGDPVNFVGQEILHDSNAYYAVNYSNIQLVAEDPADYQKELVDEFEDVYKRQGSAMAQKQINKICLCTLFLPFLGKVVWTG